MICWGWLADSALVSFLPGSFCIYIVECYITMFEEQLYKLIFRNGSYGGWNLAQRSRTNSHHLEKEDGVKTRPAIRDTTTMERWRNMGRGVWETPVETPYSGRYAERAQIVHLSGGGPQDSGGSGRICSGVSGAALIGPTGRLRNMIKLITAAEGTAKAMYLEPEQRPRITAVSEESSPWIILLILPLWSHRQLQSVSTWLALKYCTNLL